MPPLLLLLLLLSGSNATLSAPNCRRKFLVGDGRDGLASTARVASDNFPLPAPKNWICDIDFAAAGAGAGRYLCLAFAEVQNVSLRLRPWPLTWPADFVDFDANGGFLRATPAAAAALALPPRHLLLQPLCIRSGARDSFAQLTAMAGDGDGDVGGDFRRFRAEMRTVDSRLIGNCSAAGINCSVFVYGSELANTCRCVSDSRQRQIRNGRLHRCLNGDFVRKELRCNSQPDCYNLSAGGSDSFGLATSDESFEFARCRRGNGFGCDFDSRQRGAHGLIGLARVTCFDRDHTRRYGDSRDCALSLSSSLFPKLMTQAQLGGIELMEVGFPRFACFRLYHTTSATQNATAADQLVVHDPVGGAVWLLMPATALWQLQRLQLSSSDSKRLMLTPVVVSGDSVGSAGRVTHLVDDLSVEAIACDEDTGVGVGASCGFEFGLCGWQTDMSVRKSGQDHTASVLPENYRGEHEQQLLQFGGGRAYHLGRRMLGRLLREGACFSAWLKLSGQFSANLQVAAVSSSGDSVLPMEVTLKLDTWRYVQMRLPAGLVAASDASSQPPLLQLRFLSPKAGIFYLDDVSLLRGDCPPLVDPDKGLCDVGEWRCESGRRCILLSRRCNGRVDCDDGSDERGCPSTPQGGVNYSLMLRIGIGGFGLFTFFLLFSYCFQRRSRQLRRQRASAASTARMPASHLQTVTSGRLPYDLRSDRQAAANLPPAYSDVAAGAENAGFSADDQPPKYEEAMEQLQAGESAT